METDAFLKDYLAGQSKEKLVELILHLSEQDPILHQRLAQSVISPMSNPLDLDAVRRQITEATRTGGFVDYHHVPEFAAQIQQKLVTLQGLLQEGQAEVTKELSEYTIRRTEKALGEADDSDGMLAAILGDLRRLHLAACRAARPDPVRLARELFKAGLHGEWDTFVDASKEYAEVLGDEGLAEFRHQAEAQWAQLPTLGPGQNDLDKYGFRFRITHIMETLAEATGDVEALLEIKKRDLSEPYNFLEVAQIYRQAERFDEALEWAERGLAAFNYAADIRLIDFAAEEYQRRGRHAEALQLIWRQYTTHPGLERYQKLYRFATAADQWPFWRAQALEHLRGDLKRKHKHGPQYRWMADAFDHSRLVEIFLWEGDIDAAWQEALSGGCSLLLWERLGRLRETEHPADAIAAYQRLVDPIVDQRNNSAYDEAAEILKRIKQLMVRLHNNQDFHEYLEKVRARHRQKRNFMKRIVAL